MAQVRPFLRWAGSKRKIMARIEGLAPPEYEMYREPFMGSASTFFTLEPKRSVLSDINRDLVQTFNAIKRSYRSVHKYYADLPTDSATYYEVREQQPEELDQYARAGRFVYLNRLCFNGLYRTNKAGFFNVPYGGAKSGKLPSLGHLQEVSRLLRRSTIKHQDFELATEQASAGDFLFIDPPYLNENGRVFREYGPSVFTHKDFDRLQAALRALDSNDIMFLLTFADTKAARRAFAPWRVGRSIIRRNIAGFAAARRRTSELLVWNYD